RRVQRQVHGRPDGAPRRLLPHAARSRPAHVPKLLPAVRGMADDGHPTREGRMSMAFAHEPFGGARGRFLEDVLAGLDREPKRLAPKYFYDRTGSLLFDAICDLPEYYLTRTELAIVRGQARAITAEWGDRVRVVEPGAGSGTK